MTQTCIAPEMQTVCVTEQIADGDVCSGTGFVGICQRQLCLPGCGDGELRQETEQCDDGNFKSHDGCSSACMVEQLSWREVPDPWAGVLGHAAAYQSSNGTLMLFGGQSVDGRRANQWFTRGVEMGIWRSGSPAIAPAPRSGAMMAYDSVRNVIVLFGGQGGGLLDDTWEWTLISQPDELFGTWTQVTTSTRPPPRRSGQMVFDEDRQVMVLFGGVGTGAALRNDTWEFNGTTWVERSAATRPAARHGFGLAYDHNFNRTMLFGGTGPAGALEDTWVYTNGTWTAAGTAPPGLGRRADLAMSWSPTRNTIVLFGGLHPDAEGLRPMNDTWEFNGSWSRLTPLRTPPARSLATLTALPQSVAYSARTVLIGGAQIDGQLPLSDVWELDVSGQWKDITPVLMPPARYGSPAVYDVDARHIVMMGGAARSGTLEDSWQYVQNGWTYGQHLGGFANALPIEHAAVAYDEKRKRVVMFGGVRDGAVLAETRETPSGYSLAWELRTPVVSPPPRRYGVLGFDGDVLVYVGGRDVNDNLLTETWTYDGATWSQESTSSGIAPTQQPAAAYDPVHRRLVMFDRQGTTWAHQGGAWTMLVEPSDTTPPGRDNAAMTFDWETLRMIMMGGEGDQLLDDVWELDDRTWRKLDVPSIGPLPRLQFGLASSAYHRETFLIAGAGLGAVSYGDMWGLQYRSSTPDEICDNVDADGNPIDDDGDLHANMADPDCCGFEENNVCLP